ncbi:hypothetical protein M8J76_001896 [Diaphorina citri]|nr:hypothetical protein M8J76_001896 [Diaphorina citri]
MEDRDQPNAVPLEDPIHGESHVTPSCSSLLCPSTALSLPSTASQPHKSNPTPDDIPTCSSSLSLSKSSSSPEDQLDEKIRSKINDLNQTFLRIINSLKIMNVRNRNSGQSNLVSNGQMLSLFDDFLNISHLLNIKINYLYNTYVSRSSVKKYVSAINYKLYVFNINSFELSQGIDKDNRKHKKYQILHDLNISEMTNNVKLFNFVDDVAVNPAGSEESKDVTANRGQSSMEHLLAERANEKPSIKPGHLEHTCEIPESSCAKQFPIDKSNKDSTDKQCIKRLKRKTECHSVDSDDDNVASSSDDVESSRKIDSNTKKLKTMELDTDGEEDNVDIFNNLFKEINSNILELSKDIDVLNTYLKLTLNKEPASPDKPSGNVNEDENTTSEEEEDEVNSIQEEMMSRQRERNERSLVNEAVLMAIQRHGLQHQQDEDQDETSSSVQSPPGAIQSKSDSADQNKVDSHSSGSLHNTPTTSPNLAIHTSRTSEQSARLPVQTGHRGSNESTVAPICKTENSNNEDRLRSESGVNSVQNTSETAIDPDENSECRRSSEENARISDQYGRISERGPSIGNELGRNSEGNPSISDQYGRFSEENPSISDQYGRFSEENPGISDQYGGISEGGPSICDDFGRSGGDSRLNEDDDFLTQAVSVAISKKGLSA